MKPRHTPGPWRTGDMYHTVFGPPNGNPCPEIIASVHKGNKANARLIVSAPILEGLLREVVRAGNANTRALNYAIKKASPGWLASVRGYLAYIDGREGA